MQRGQCRELLCKHLLDTKTIYLDINTLRRLDYTFDIQEIDPTNVYLTNRHATKMFKHTNKLIKEIVGSFCTIIVILNYEYSCIFTSMPM